MKRHNLFIAVLLSAITLVGCVMQPPTPSDSTPSTPSTQASEPTTQPTTVPTEPTTLPTTVPTEPTEPPVGWVEKDGKRFYYTEDSVMVTGWLQMGYDSYYFDADGAMAVGKRVIDGQDWYFGSDGVMILLVNPWNLMPDGYEPETITIRDGQAVDARCYEALMQMIADCRAAGYCPQVGSSFRTMERQIYLYNRKVNYYLDKGYSQAEAEAVAGTIVARPGTSEHQLGLAVDMVSDNNWNLNESQEQNPTQIWLMENSWRYGWILRYPNEKSDVTGIIYEPWHYRYVGVTVAKEIHDSGMCLEEYLESLG